MVRSVTLRAATLDELERTDSTDHANLTDGALAVLVDGLLVGITNEYGTAVYFDEAVGKGRVEALADVSCDFLALEVDAAGRLR